MAGPRAARIALESARIFRPEYCVPSIVTLSRITCVFAAAVMLAACAGQKQPARQLIDEIDASVIAASGEAAKYVPLELADVQTRLGNLKDSFARKDYAAVVTEGPAVLDAAQSLATAAAAKKDALLKALNDDWTLLADSVPGNITAVRNRIDFLDKKAGKKATAGIDINAAKAGIADAASLWSKAQAAFAAGNMDEAVSTANRVKAKVEAVAASLQLDLPA
jgi:hypothetical protein